MNKNWALIYLRYIYEPNVKYSQVYNYIGIP
jgi:hypothetical protein